MSDINDPDLQAQQLRLQAISHDEYLKRKAGHLIKEAEANQKALEEEMAAARDPWRHRSDNMKCKTCMWFVPKKPNAKPEVYDLGRCRRRAPTMSGYPAVYVNDWCGDHKIDENVVRPF